MSIGSLAYEKELKDLSLLIKQHQKRLSNSQFCNVQMIDTKTIMIYGSVWPEGKIRKLLQLLED